ncbi:MAG: hypothetical protein NWE91_01565 [Candidatus Bathyarchaeota archaeon]|nr:hypothetical protein [Candidatus Bathyarchaeota archaeon]
MGDNEFIQTKNALLRFFTGQATSQAARLIGFTIALFALLQTAQYSRQEPLSSVFSALQFPMILNELYLEGLKFLVLFVSILVILTFMIRAIFRFSVFSYLSEYLIKINKNDIGTESDGKTVLIDGARHIHEATYMATVNYLREWAYEGELKLYFFLPLVWVIGEKGRAKWKDWILYFPVAIAFTCFLLLLLW